MAMVILLSLFGLEGQISSSLEDMPQYHPQLSTEEGRKMALASTLSFLGLEGQTSSALEDMP